MAHNLKSFLATLARPRTLARAARAGARLYRRERDLAAVLPSVFAARPKDAALIKAIAESEAQCDSERRNGAVTYSAARHAAILAALIAECLRMDAARTARA